MKTSLPHATHIESLATGEGLAAWVVAFLYVIATCNPSEDSSPWKGKKSEKKYFTSSDPHHDMLGGCQVMVVI